MCGMRFYIQNVIYTFRYKSTQQGLPCGQIFCGLRRIPNGLEIPFFPTENLLLPIFIDKYLKFKKIEYLIRNNKFKIWLTLFYVKFPLFLKLVSTIFHSLIFRTKQIEKKFNLVVFSSHRFMNIHSRLSYHGLPAFLKLLLLKKELHV